MVCLTHVRLAPPPLLFKPVDPVAVALAVDDIHLAVAVHVVADDRKARVLHLPVAMPLPLILVGIDLLEPAVRRKDVCLAVAVDIGHADAVPILRAPAHVVHLGLGSGEVDPQNTHVAVVPEDQIGLAVAVDVGHPAALRVVAVGDEVPLPLRAELPRILPPEDAVGHPAGSDHVGQPIVIHVDRPLAAVGDELVHHAHFAILVPLPLAALRTRVFIPIRPTQNVRSPVAVHVQRSDALGVIRAQAMDKECSLLHAARSRSPLEVVLVVGCAGGCAPAANVKIAAAKAKQAAKRLIRNKDWCIESHFIRQFSSRAILKYRGRHPQDKSRAGVALREAFSETDDGSLSVHSQKRSPYGDCR